MNLIEYFSVLPLPKEIVTIIVASMPVFELRGAIPLAITVYDISIPAAYILSVFGNLIPVFFVIFFLEKFSEFLMSRSVFFDRFFKRLFSKIEVTHKYKFEYWGPFALMMFVAVPLPMTGAWSGSVAAFVFRIPFLQALKYIMFGVMISGAIVTSLSVGLITIF